MIVPFNWRKCFCYGGFDWCGVEIRDLGETSVVTQYRVVWRAPFLLFRFSWKIIWSVFLCSSILGNNNPLPCSQRTQDQRHSCQDFFSVSPTLTPHNRFLPFLIPLFYYDSHWRGHCLVLDCHTCIVQAPSFSVCVVYWKVERNAGDYILFS